MPFDVFNSINSNERFHRFTFGVSGLPLWARGVLAVPMIPGMLLVGLSIVLFIVSLLALLILTVPVYLLLKWITGSGVVETAVRPSGSRRVEATVRDVSE